MRSRTGSRRLATCGSSLDGSGTRITPGPGELRAFSTMMLLGGCLRPAPGPVVDRERDVREDSAEGRGARDQTRDAAGRDRASVLGVRVGRHDDLDRWVEPTGDLGDRATGRLPAHPLSAARRRLEAALVDHEHVGLRRRVRSRSSCTARLAASASSWKVRPATPVGVTIVGVASRTSPMKPTSMVFPLPDVNSLTPNAGKKGLTGRVHDDVRREVLEVRAREDVGRASRLRARREPPVHPATGWQPPFWIRRSSAAALVELVVADRCEIDVHQVARRS